MLKLSKHAIDRYKERVKNVDIKEIERDINNNVERLYNILGNGLYPLHHKYVVIKDGVVITIIPTKVNQWRYEL